MTEQHWCHYSDLPSPEAYMTKPAFIQLDKRQWRDVHNALCAVERQTQGIFDVLKHGTELRDAVEALRGALKPAYEQEEAQWDQRFTYCDNVKLNSGFAAVWSAEDVDFDQPHPFLSDAFIQYHGDKRYPIMGPTWLDVYRAADLAIRDSGDSHHIFIEQFRPQSDNTVILHTGS
jgi:hypothetical protein